MEKTVWKTNRKVLLEVTGGIAAYKTPSLVRYLVQNEFEVTVVLTAEAERFVSPMVLSVLSGNKTWRQEDFLSDEHGWEIPHIRLAEWADIILIAPATADSISRAAGGEAFSLTGSIVLASKVPVLFVPAMNENMFENSITQSNIKTLIEAGYYFIDPDSGFLACGYNAKGRMPDNASITEEIFRNLCPSRALAGKRVLVTAGPTWEFIDPVRYLSNPSSGKMGVAMARNAWYRGAEVTLVCGPLAEKNNNTYGMDTLNVISAWEMYDKVMSVIDSHDYIIKAAAVSDYRPCKAEKNKIKKRQGFSEKLKIEFEKNPDIAFEIGRLKRQDQVLVGFAAETENILEYAEAKMKEKNMDFVAANDVTAEDAGFSGDTNSVRLINKNGTVDMYKGSKDYVAKRIWDKILEEDGEQGCC